MVESGPSDFHGSMLRARRLGMGLILVFFGGFGAWAATAPLDGAIVASGKLEVSGAVKRIQHVSGGTVAQILVREGDRVAAGQVLLRLDDTVARANLGIISSQLNTLRVRAARLAAEVNGQPDFAEPSDLWNDDPSRAQIMEGERRLLTTRLAARSGQRAQIDERMAQLQSQVNGLDLQAKAKSRESALMTADLEGLRKLDKTGLVPRARLNETERGAARLEGELGMILTAMAETRGKIAETRLQRLNIDETAVADAQRELRETEAKIDEFTERALAARDLLDHSAITAPVAGIVHQLAVHTIGGVVAPGGTVMSIVPVDAELVVEARIAAQDVESVHAGWPAVIRLSGLNRATTPELHGVVSMVGADLVQDEATRSSYYPVRIAIAPESRASVQGVTLVPGMPAETFLVTGSRTFLDYLIKPIGDRAGRAFREE